MNLRKYCFIYNPASNYYKSRSKFEKLRYEISHWHESEILISSEKGDIPRLVRQAERAFDVIVACGGDGTLRETAISLIGTKTLLGVIPMGSGNDFAKALNIPYSIDDALQLLLKGKIRSIDMGKCNEFYFINTLGFGFDGITNKYASQMKWFSGRIKYMVAALKSTFTMEPFWAAIKFQNHKIKKRILMVTICNGMVEGGKFIVAPTAKPYDQKFEILLVSPIAKWKLPMLMRSFISGKLDDLSAISNYSTSQDISLIFDKPVDIHADGEIIDTVDKEFTVNIIPNAVNMITGNHS